LVDRTAPARSRLALGCTPGLIVLLLATLAFLLPPSTAFAAGRELDSDPPPAQTARVYLPVISKSITDTPAVTFHTHLPLLLHQPALKYSCPESSTAVWPEMAPWQSLIAGAALSPDLNMNVRGWYPVDEYLGFVSYPYPPEEPPDTLHPLQLSNIADSTPASFIETYQMNDWDWSGCRCPVPRTSSPYPVTMLGLHTAPGQPLHVASRNTPVDPAGYAAIVLYADARQIAVKYTGEDRVDNGYLLHLVNLCVDPNLLALYQRLDAAGRHTLPAVTNLSAVGVALGYEVDVIVRDSGSFLDPRSWQDWWQDQPPPAATGP
jgi:hypothetical protein